MFTLVNCPVKSLIVFTGSLSRACTFYTLPHVNKTVCADDVAVSGVSFIQFGTSTRIDKYSHRIGTNIQRTARPLGVFSPFEHDIDLNPNMCICYQIGLCILIHLPAQTRILCMSQCDTHISDFSLTSCGMFLCERKTRDYV